MPQYTKIMNSLRLLSNEFSICYYTYLSYIVMGSQMYWCDICTTCRHQSTGAVIARGSQPEVSWWGWRNADDEHLVQSIARACTVDGSSPKTFINRSFSHEYQNGPDLSDGDFG